MRAGEISFYILAGTMAITLALQPRGLIAAGLFIAFAALLLAIGLEG
jgi:hypothetical protein